MWIGLNVCFSISVRLDGILLNCALLIDVLKSTPRECQPVFPATVWQKDLDNQDKSLKAQFSFAFHLSGNKTWCSGEDKQCLSLLNTETSRQKRLACGQTGMWAEKQTERHVDIKGRILSDRQARRPTDKRTGCNSYHDRFNIHVRAFPWRHAGAKKG